MIQVISKQDGWAERLDAEIDVPGFAVRFLRYAIIRAVQRAAVF
jgi:hypothetical protein